MLPGQYMKPGHGYAIALALIGVLVAMSAAHYGVWWSGVCLTVATIVSRQVWQWTDSDACDEVSRQLIRGEWVVLCALLVLIMIGHLLGWAIIIALTLIAVYVGFVLMQESHRVHWLAEQDR